MTKIKRELCVTMSTHMSKYVRFRAVFTHTCYTCIIATHHALATVVPSRIFRYSAMLKKSGLSSYLHEGCGTAGDK